MREADDAEQEGRPIDEVREFRRLAREALERSQAELQGVTSSGSIEGGGGQKAVPGEVSSAADEAPEAYRQMVSDYYKSISTIPQK
jgi:hypothetical protein